MKRNIIVLFACHLIVLCAAAQDKTIPKQAGIIDSVFTALHKDGTFNGNVLIADKGKVLFSKSYGYADEQAGIKLNEQTIFELASCSKQFTAAGIVLLHQEGKLSYDDPLSKWIPELEAYKGITIRHLLHHTSGLPDYMYLMDSLWDHHKIASNKDMIAFLKQYHPEAEFAPGERFEYSNTGYAVLASVIEAASGLSYDAFLKDSIFTPLRMSRTFVYTRRFAPRKVSNYAYGYVYSNSQQRKVLPDSIPELDRVYFLDGIKGDGTVNSTVGDLLKWDRALYHSVLFSVASKELMFREGKLNDQSGTAYGMGWMLKTDSLMGHIAAHSGGWPGYSTYIERHLDKDKTIIILQNNYDVKMPVKALRSILYDQPLKAAPVRKEVMLKEEMLVAYSGTYELAPDFKITVSVQNGQLMAQATGQSPFRLYAASETQFFLKVVDAQVDFEKDAEGKIYKLILHQGGRDMPALRINQ